MISQIKNNKVIRVLLILLILIVSITFLYKLHFESKFGGYDNLEWYNEVKERDTLEKIIDYKYPSEQLSPSSYYNPIQPLIYNPIQLLIWRYMVTHYDKNHYQYLSINKIFK